MFSLVRVPVRVTDSASVRVPIRDAIRKPGSTFAGSMRATLALVLLAVANGMLVAQAPMSLTELEDCVRTGYPAERLVEEIRRTSGPRLTKEQITQLERLGATRELVAALHAISSEAGGSPAAFVDELLRRAESGDPEALIHWIMRQGASPELELADYRRLREKGLRDEVLRAVNGQHVFAGYRTYSDPMGTMAIQYPATWNTYQWWTGDGYKVLLSPEHGVREVNQFTTGLQLQVHYLPAGHRVHADGIAKHHARELPSLLRLNRGFELRPDGTPRTTMLAGREAVEQDFTVRMLGLPCRERLARTTAQDLCYFIEFVAPADRYEGLAEVRERMLASFRALPQESEPRRGARAADAAEMRQRCLPAVVMIEAQFERGLAGTGSGFVVREDGMVLTNAHVVTTEDGKVAERITVVLEELEGRRRLEVELIDVVHERMPMIDLALLRLPRRKDAYPTLPISRIASGRVLVGDEIITLGFPGLGGGRLYLTSGCLTAINSIETRVGDKVHRRLNDLVTDATIAPGNSGGPCISLKTGGVIGLNTYIPLVKGQGYDYAGVCLIDHAFEVFPQLRWYPRHGSVSAEQHLEIGAMLCTLGKMRAASKELEAAMREKNDLTSEQQAILFWNLALVRHADGDWSGFTALRDRCLALDPTHRSAAPGKALELAGAEKLSEALAIASRLEKRYPDEWFVRDLRAQVYACGQTYDLALQELAMAAEMADGSAPEILVRRGSVLARIGRSEEALAAYQAALASDPHDLSARQAIAEHWAAQGQHGKARIEYHRLVTEHADDSQAHAARASYLAGRGEHGDAVEEMMQAVVLDWAAGRSAASYLEQGARICAQSAEHLVTGIVFAQALLRCGKAWHDDGHRALARLWRQQGDESLARMHDAAGSGSAGPVLSEAVLAKLIAAAYTPATVQGLLQTSSLGFVLDKDLLPRLAKVPGIAKVGSPGTELEFAL